MTSSLIIQHVLPKVWGEERCIPSTDLPFQLKWISTRSPLSVQVHPPTQNAWDAEIWCVVEARPDSLIHIDLAGPATREEILRALEERKITSLMNEFRPVRGDCYRIPSGTLHCLGAGLTVLEMAPIGNITMRLDDWERKDASRPLRIEECLEILLFPKDRMIQHNPLNETR